MKTLLLIIALISLVFPILYFSIAFYDINDDYNFSYTKGMYLILSDYIKGEQNWKTYVPLLFAIVFGLLAYTWKDRKPCIEIINDKKSNS